jgi:diphosphomevalonate decarboxylase
MTDNYFQNKYVLESSHLQKFDKKIEGKTGWRSPSNIALIKYWGKYGNQLPRNASVSFSLSKSYTETSIKYKSIENKGLQLEYYFNGSRNLTFEAKLVLYLRSLLPFFPFLDWLHLKVESVNNFPYGAGIASSASGVSALALGICSIERNEFESLKSDHDFYRKASFVSRIGSGSACRSIYGGTALWGQLHYVSDSHNEIAIPFDSKVHSVFKNYYDSILVTDSSPKDLPSSAGHNLMNHHVYADTRFRHAEQNMKNLLPALEKGDQETFTKIVENEALTLHALMFSSDPGYILLHPHTLNIIKVLKKFRQETQTQFAYTLDAGPNIHLLYPESSREAILPLIENELSPLCEKGYWIDDKVGKGPELMC